MMQRFYLPIALLFAVLLLLFESCEYDCSKKAYVDLPAPADTTSVSVEFVGYSLKDTIVLSEKDSIPYTLIIRNGILESSVFRLDTLTLSSENNYIRIDSLFTSGITYPLNHSLHVSSGTGSLADIMNVEGVNYDNRTMLYVKFDY